MTGTVIRKVGIYIKIFFPYHFAGDKPGQIGSWKSVVDVASHLKSVPDTMPTLEARDARPVFRLDCNRNALFMFHVINVAFFI